MLQIILCQTPSSVAIDKEILFISLANLGNDFNSGNIRPQEYRTVANAKVPFNVNDSPFAYYPKRTLIMYTQR